MPRFTQDNTSGYSAGELKTLNAAFDRRCAASLREDDDSDFAEQVKQYIAEQVLADFDASEAA